ncbi:hypothetical protein Hanom_Chr02g00111171 [Helianthus anomalus]
MSANRNIILKQYFEINTLKETIGKQQGEIAQLRAENERLKAADDERERQLQQMRAADNVRGIDMNRLKEKSNDVLRTADKLSGKYNEITKWYDSRNKVLAGNVKQITRSYEVTRKRVNTLWADKCKEEEMLQKRDHDSEDQGNHVASAPSEPQGVSSSTQVIVYRPQQTVTPQGTSGGLNDDVAQLDSGIAMQVCPTKSQTTDANVASSSADIDLQACPSVDRKDFEDGVISEMTDEQILGLIDMKVVGDTTIDELPSDVEKSKYVREVGTEFNPFDEEWLKDNVDEIDKRLKNCDSFDIPADSFEESRKNFLSKTAKPAPPIAQVDYMKYEKNLPLGRILSWMFVKELHCVAVKREHGIQYFKSLLSILTLPFYDIAVLARLELRNQSNFEGAKLFARKLKMERRKGWKDEFYKPQFPMYEQIKFTLDPVTNTARYRLVYKPMKVLDRIPQMQVEQYFLENMALWCYNSDTHEAVIVFRNEKENVRILDPMWIVNMSAVDIDRLFHHNIFYEDKDASQALRFQRVACYCYYWGIHAGSSLSGAAH